MSAPPSCVVDPPAMPTMVSRLPKFGSRPKSATVANNTLMGPAATATTGSFASATATTSTRLTNGFYHHPGPVGMSSSVATPPSNVKQNGFIRVPTSFSTKWRKENAMMEDSGIDAEKDWRRGKGGNVKQQRSGISLHQYNPQEQQGLKPTTSSAGKSRGVRQPVTSSTSPQSSPRILPVSKTGLHRSKPGMTNSTKPIQSSLSGCKPRSGTNGSLPLSQSFTRTAGSGPGSGPGSRSGSPLQKEKLSASRSQSSESLRSVASVQLSEKDRLRSRSLIQMGRQPSPTLTTSSSLARSPTTTTRSYSINRAAERGLKELTAPSIQALPAHTSTKSLATGQTPDGGGRGVKVKSLVGPSILPPSALKKPLIPSPGSAPKPSGISYRMSRPSLIKQARPLRATPVNVMGSDPMKQGLIARSDSVETPSTTENSPDGTPEVPEMEGLSTELVSQTEVSIVGETLEDMSLSSTSSLDRNDTSQEYMDDFDNLGNGGVDIILLSSKNDEEDSGLDQSCTRFDDDKVSIKAKGLCFLDDGMDWAGMRLSSDQTERLTQLSRRMRSSQPDYHDQGGSSLDLSPSDSCGSGGTYMWDEEGLEPLGPISTASITINSSNTTHHIGSFDSDLNSIDILNNLDSCDLEDDDLMLDADLAEDVSLHSDTDGMSHMAQWRRRQLCWGTQDVHDDNESDFQCYNLTEDPGNKRTDSTSDRDFILDLCPSRSPCLSPGTTGLGLDVELLAEDCSAVRSQLEYLHRLLLQEEEVDDETLTTDTLSPEANESSQSSDSQVQALLQEVQQLREELRSRDRTIAQLTLQLTVPPVTTRCCCQETIGKVDRHTQTSVTERESVASQTPWREHTSQILHSSTQKDQEPLMHQVLTPPTAHALPPVNPLAEIPADRLPDRLDGVPTDSTTEERGNDGKRSTNERRGASSRSLKLPQPSKLHLFLPLTSRSDSSSSCASTAAPPLKLKASRQPLTPHDPENGCASGVKLKTSASSSAASRLPKPKSH